MIGMKDTAAQAVRKAGALVLAAVVAATLSVGLLAAPAQASASTGNLVASSAQLGTQASDSLASANKSTISKTVKKNAKAIVKSSKVGKVTKANAQVNLKKIYKYIATDKSFGGTFSFPDSGYLYFYMKATSNANKGFYPVTQPTNMKDYYKKYAVDAYKTKQASCHHYAALFAVAAKQALGNVGTVKIGTRNVLKDGVRDVHSWVEATIGKTTYIYDTQKGNSNSKKTGDKAGFGKYCGSKKSSVKSLYGNFREARYCTVAL